MNSSFNQNSFDFIISNYGVNIGNDDERNSTQKRNGFNQNNHHGVMTKSNSNGTYNSSNSFNFNQPNPNWFKTESISNESPNSFNSFNFNKSNNNSESKSFNHWDMSSNNRKHLAETLPLNNTDESFDDTQGYFDPNPNGFKNEPNTLEFKKDSFRCKNVGSRYGWNMDRNRHHENNTGPRVFLENDTTQEKFNKGLWSYDTSTQIKQEKSNTQITKEISRFKFWQKLRK